MKRNPNAGALPLRCSAAAAPSEHLAHDLPEAGSIAIAFHQGRTFPLDEIDAHGTTLFDVEVRNESLIDFSDPSERVELESVRNVLEDGQAGGPFIVDAIRNPDDPGIVDISVVATDSLTWNGLFTEDELDEHRSIAETVYREKLNADIAVSDGWDRMEVILRADIPTSRAAVSLITDRAQERWAAFQNQTDPGTYGVEYIGTEIRRRIAASAASDEAA